MKIKVCGMRDPDNIRALASLNIDMMGMIFWPGSKRYVPLCSSALEVVAPEDFGIRKVGVFVDAPTDFIVEHADRYRLDYVQLHGNETPEMLAELHRRLPDISLIKALSIKEADDVKRWRRYSSVADMLLFDTKCTCMGGSGRQFDWSVLESYSGHLPFLLSGGIGPDDAGRITGISHPLLAGIDLNSRFESAPAVKDITLLKHFINELRQ